MKDIIIKKIELNENYHQSKEKLAWVATSLYLTFIVVSYKWLYKESFYFFEEALPTIIILSVVYLSALAFVSFQFRHRWQSVYKSYALHNLLAELENDTPPSAFPEKYKIQIDKEKNKKENIDSRYHTEIPTYAILTYFFFVQIVVSF